MKTVRFTLICSTIFLFSICAHTAYAQNLSIHAKYNVKFGGVKLGSFKFQSNVQNNRYDLTGKTKLLMMGGVAMDWRMQVHSGGEIKNHTPQPASFGYSFKNKKKKKKRSVKFTHSADGTVGVTPGLKNHKKKVPVKAEHLKSVYDPMSALILLTHSNGEPLSRQICSRTIRLFDGRERYDIALKFKTVKKVDIGHKKNKRAKSYVCSLSYVPISGHKRKDKTKRDMAKMKGIEVWFSPLQKANIYVPHLIKIPTPFGATTTIQAKSFTVQRGGGQKIAYIK